MSFFSWIYLRFYPPRLVSGLGRNHPFVGTSNISAFGGGSFILSFLAGESRCVSLQPLLVERNFLDIVFSGAEGINGLNNIPSFAGINGA